MLIIPAIDLKDGRCVRLKQGDMSTATVFSDDPVAMARHWAAQGAKRLHIVDLNGAVAGRPKNEKVIRDMLAVPMCLLYEAGLFLARFISVRRKEQSDYKAESG